MLSTPSTTRSFAAAAAAAALLAAGLVGTAPASAARVDDVLTTGERLEPGDSLASPSGRYRVQLDDSGTLSLVERANWLTGTDTTYLTGPGVAFVVAQGDGNLVAYRADGSVAYASGTDGSGATSVRLQDDRNLVFFGADGRVVADAASYNDQVLIDGRALLPRDHVRGENGVSRLLMQTDGNLVLYRGSTPLWSSRTQNNPGAGAVMQSDGNLVVYSSAATGRRTLFDTGTGGIEQGPVGPFPFLEVEDTEVSVNIAFEDSAGYARWGSNWTSDRVLPGDELDSGDRRVSTDGSCTLVMQADANLVEYCGGRAVFSTGVSGRWLDGEPFEYPTAIMQADGNFVVYEESYILGVRPRVLYNTGTRVPGSGVVLQSDSNVVVVAPTGRPVWSRVTGPL